ncbi:MAG: hypothetical protein J6T01_05105 [Kiritimatiellae bacterium]|nr:hypothetical protein [Kiritimatiellia bacterium]
MKLFRNCAPKLALAASAAFAAECAPGALTSDAYVQSGLVAHYDAIDNAGVGVHDDNATVWKDLAGVAGDMQIDCDTHSWTNNHLKLKCTAAKNGTDRSKFLDTPNALSLPNAAGFTVEMRFKPTTVTMRWLDVHPYNAYLENYQNNSSFRGTTVAFDMLPEQWAYYVLICTNNIHTVRRTIGNRVQSATSAAGSANFTVNHPFAFFKATSDGVRVEAIRIYNRVLNNDEIDHNRRIDMARFRGRALGGVSGGTVSYGTAAVAGTGGTVTFDGRTGTDIYAEHLLEGQPLPLSATPEPGFAFTGWSGDVDGFTADDLRSPSIELARGYSRRLVANFAATGVETARDYIRDGLLVMLDAKDNAGFGAHENAPVYWRDLSGHDRYAELADTFSGTANPAWTERSVSFSGAKYVIFNWDGDFLSFATSDTARTLQYCSKFSSFQSDTPLVKQSLGGNWGIQTMGTDGRTRFYNGAADMQFSTATALFGAGSTDSYSHTPGGSLYRRLNYSTQYTTAWKAVSTKPTYIGGFNYNSAKSVTGHLYAFRVYNRDLDLLERYHNVRLDKIRFFGCADTTNFVGSAAEYGVNYGSPVPAYGKMTSVVKGEPYVFSVESSLTNYALDGVYAVKISEGVRARYLGAKFTAVVDGAFVDTEHPYTVHEFTANVTNDCRVSWKWERQCLLTVGVTAAGGGAVSVAGGGEVQSYVAWHNDDETVSVTATPDADHVFLCWRGTGDVLVGHESDATLQAPMTVARTLTAMFAEKGQAPRTATWTGGASTPDWDDPANWDGAVPVAGDTVVIGGGGAACAVQLTHPTPAFASLAVGTNVTLTLSGWGSRVLASEVTIANGGTVTSAGPIRNGEMSNRVWFVCDRLTVEKGGAVNVNKRGFRSANGPGLRGQSSLTSYRGGAYGGWGFSPDSANRQQPYGSLTEPQDLGSGGTGQSNPTGTDLCSGGGSVRIDATGLVTVNGSISADGAPTSTWQAGAGSGGSVYIGCSAITGSGKVSASSSDLILASGSSSSYSGGSGGRIAVLYDAAAQNACDAGCTVAFRAAGSVAHVGSRGISMATSEGYLNDTAPRPTNEGDPGTLYFTDNRFLTSQAYLDAGWRFAGEWHSAEGTAGKITVPGSVNLSGVLAFTEGRPDVEITGSVTASGGHARATGFILANALFKVRGDLTLRGGMLKQRGGETEIGGDFLMSSRPPGSSIYSSQLHVWALATNGAPDDVWGARLHVGGKWTMESNTVGYIHTHATNGSVPYFTAGSFKMEQGAVLDAYDFGYSPGYGPGISKSSAVGASHGGRGGAKTQADFSKYGVPTYGSEQEPVTPGSAGSSKTSNTTPGPGAIIIHADRNMSFDGMALLQAEGRSNSGWCGVGSGGSVYLKAGRFRSSTGRICAKGGRGDKSAGYGPGGGGRVAIWARVFSSTNIDINVSGGTKSSKNEVAAEPGTIYWGRLPPIGMSIFVR